MTVVGSIYGLAVQSGWLLTAYSLLDIGSGDELCVLDISGYLPGWGLNLYTPSQAQSGSIFMVVSPTCELLIHTHWNTQCTTTPYTGLALSSPCQSVSLLSVSYSATEQLAVDIDCLIQVVSATAVTTHSVHYSYLTTTAVDLSITITVVDLTVLLVLLAPT